MHKDILEKLVKLANKLDEKGFYEEAAEIDELTKSAVVPPEKQSVVLRELYMAIAEGFNQWMRAVTKEVNDPRVSNRMHDVVGELMNQCLPAVQRAREAVDAAIKEEEAQFDIEQ